MIESFMKPMFGWPGSREIGRGCYGSVILKWEVEEEENTIACWDLPHLSYWKNWEKTATPALTLRFGAALKKTTEEGK